MNETAAEAFRDVTPGKQLARCHRCGHDISDPSQRVALNTRAYNYVNKRALGSAARRYCPPCGRLVFDQMVTMMDDSQR